METTTQTRRAARLEFLNWLENELLAQSGKWEDENGIIGENIEGAGWTVLVELMKQFELKPLPVNPQVLDKQLLWAQEEAMVAFPGDFNSEAQYRLFMGLANGVENLLSAIAIALDEFGTVTLVKSQDCDDVVRAIEGSDAVNLADELEDDSEETCEE